MQRVICIPVEQYELMVKTYDEIVVELEEMKKALEEAGTSSKGK